MNNKKRSIIDDDDPYLGKSAREIIAAAALQYSANMGSFMGGHKGGNKGGSRSDSYQPFKKQKAYDGSGREMLWRDKCITDFNLQTVPDLWKDCVLDGSEDAWRRYYLYRARIEKDEDARKNISNEPVDESDEYGKWEQETLQEIMNVWTKGDQSVDKVAEEVLIEGCPKWIWTPQRPAFEREENEDKIRSITYKSHIWAPYAIPRALRLSHNWGGKDGQFGGELNVDWNYQLLDFDHEDVERSNIRVCELCANKQDVIDTSHMTKSTCYLLRRHIFGAFCKESKLVTCSDRDFYRLVFASMGTVDRDMLMDPKDCSLGYSWCPWREPGFTQKLFDEKANADDEPEGEPPTDIKTYNPRMCSWLRYRMLDQTDSIGPISKYYKPPLEPKGSDYEEDAPSSGMDDGDY